MLQLVRLTNTYAPGMNQLYVYINAARQYSDAYIETNANTVTFTGALTLGDEVLFEIGKVVDIREFGAASTTTYSPTANLADGNVQAALTTLANAQAATETDVSTLQSDLTTLSNKPNSGSDLFLANIFGAL